MNPILQPVDDLLSSNAATIQQQKSTIAQLSTQSKQPDIFDYLQYVPWNLAPGASANTKSTGPIAEGMQFQPGQNTAKFAISPNGPYANNYWYQKFGSQYATRTRFKQEGSFLFPSVKDIAACQCIEFDLQHVISQRVFNLGFQFNYQLGLLRYWNRGQKSWVQTLIKAPRPLPNVWTVVSFDLLHDDKNVYYNTATIDNQVHQLGLTIVAPTLPLSDMLNYGFQLDTNGQAQPYTVCIDRMRLTAW